MLKTVLLTVDQFGHFHLRDKQAVSKLPPLGCSLPNFWCTVGEISALTLFVAHHEERPVCKILNDVLLVWLSVWSKVQMICI